MAVLDSVYIQGAYNSKITFIVRPIHMKVHFLHFYTIKMWLKMYVDVLKIFDFAIPMHTSTFPQDFPQLIFQQWGPLPPQPPLKKPPMKVFAESM